MSFSWKSSSARVLRFIATCHQLIRIVGVPNNDRFLDFRSAHRSHRPKRQKVPGFNWKTFVFQKSPFWLMAKAVSHFKHAKNSNAKLTCKKPSNRPFDDRCTNSNCRTQVFRQHLLASRGKPHFGRTHFAPVFSAFSFTGRIGGVFRDFEV